MIITKRKPDEELLAMLKDVKNVVLVGCGECATMCKTGGEEELEEMKKFLAEHGVNVLGTVLPQTGCNKLLVKKDLKNVKEVLPQCDAIISMACGDGVQTVANNVKMPVYPANNTMFLGEIERLTLFTEACRFCGDCVLATTGGICPMTKCAKSLTNGPCGGAKNGKCEVNPENDCAWILIYNRLKELGQLDRLEEIYEPKGHLVGTYPRTVNLKEAK